MTNVKGLIEERNTLVEELEAMNAECETRTTKALTDDESATYTEKMEQIKNIDALIERAENLKKAEIDKAQEIIETKTSEVIEPMEEERTFNLGEFVRDAVNGSLAEAATRTNMTPSDNGYVIPTTIADKIIDTLKNICPIYEKATKLSFKGTVDFPVVDESADKVTVAYADEFDTLVSHTSKFSKVSLGGYLFSALTLISKSLINNAEIDVEGFIVDKMAQACKEFLEGELLIGTANKMTGWASSANVTETATAATVTADDLISVQDSIIDGYQAGCCWIMSPATRTSLRKLKDGEGRYILNNDATTGFTDQLFGKPVFVSDAMPAAETGKLAVYYGDPSGLYVNFRENMNIEILREVYHTQHAIGVNLWAEADSKIVEPQKLAVLKVK